MSGFENYERISKEIATAITAVSTPVAPPTSSPVAAIDQAYIEALPGQSDPEKSKAGGVVGGFFDAIGSGADWVKGKIGAGIISILLLLVALLFLYLAVKPVAGEFVKK